MNESLPSFGLLSFSLFLSIAEIIRVLACHNKFVIWSEQDISLRLYWDIFFSPKVGSIMNKCSSEFIDYH